MEVYSFFEYLMTLNNRVLLLLFLIFMQLLGFFLFFIDKRKAIYNKSRISERTLLWFCFFAPIGSLIAIFFIRHKNRKAKFLFPALFLILTSLLIYLVIMIYM